MCSGCNVADNRVFVFGSNLAGRHGAGSALLARLAHGAEYGVGEGPTGNAYAIPTKDKQLNVLPIPVIAKAVEDFCAYATSKPDVTFDIVAIGCGLAGYTAEDIAPLFAGAPENCHFLNDKFRQARAYRRACEQ